MTFQTECPVEEKSHDFSSSTISLYKTFPTSQVGTYCTSGRREDEKQLCVYLLHFPTRFAKLNRAKNKLFHFPLFAVLPLRSLSASLTPSVYVLNRMLPDFSAGLRASCTPVHSNSMPCSALRLQHPCRFPVVLPSGMSPYPHRLPALRLQWLHLQAPGTYSPHLCVR